MSVEEQPDREKEITKAVKEPLNSLDPLKHPLESMVEALKCLSRRFCC